MLSFHGLIDTTQQTGAFPGSFDDCANLLMIIIWIIIIRAPHPCMHKFHRFTIRAHTKTHKYTHTWGVYTTAVLAASNAARWLSVKDTTNRTLSSKPSSDTWTRCSRVARWSGNGACPCASHTLLYHIQICKASSATNCGDYDAHRVYALNRSRPAVLNLE
jgi:hypothetical protein